MNDYTDLEIRRGGLIRRLRRTLSAFGAAISIAISAHPLDVAAAIVPSDHLVAGRSYVDWVTDFYKWFLEMPYDSRHPANDYTGAQALNNQHGPVWFFPPASTPRAITRSISVPSDKWLFFAVSGTFCSTFYVENEADLQSCATATVHEQVLLEIDGVSVTSLDSFKITSSPFDFIYPPVNIEFIQGGGPGKAIGQGYNVIVQPLSPGSHVIHFGASQPEDGVSWDITYRMTVYARPSLSIRQIPGASKIELSWPDTSGFSLQAADKPEPDASWSAVSLASSALVDGTRSVTLPSELSTRYFRLYRP